MLWDKGKFTPIGSVSGFNTAYVQKCKKSSWQTSGLSLGDNPKDRAIYLQVAFGLSLDGLPKDKASSL
jgi:hypothetical protein